MFCGLQPPYAVKGRRRMRRRRVLIIVENLPAPFDRRVWQEAGTLRRAGYAVSIICPTGKGYERRFEVIDGVAIYRHPLPLEARGAWGYALEYGAALAWQMLLAVRIALTRGFDVIHACNPPDTIFLIAALFKLFGKRFVFDHHDLCPELYEAKFGKRGVLWRLMAWLERLTFRTADVVISTNQSYRRIALERGRLRPEQVFVVRSGPDLAYWPAPHPPRSAPRPTIGYLGVMGEQEGLDLFLQAMRRMVYERARDVRAVLVGDGSQRRAIEVQAEALGLSAHVTFTGRLSDPEMRARLGAVDVCVNPDRPSALNDQSTMNKVVEYMALAKPIVQFEGTEGRVSAGGSALYAAQGDTDDFADKVLQLLDDEGLRACMGAAGRRRVEDHLAWSHQEAALLAAYDRVFACKPFATRDSPLSGRVAEA
jgi:glycosyltransferase involved in cell wall biosynthesis